MTIKEINQVLKFLKIKGDLEDIDIRRGHPIGLDFYLNNILIFSYEPYGFSDGILSNGIPAIIVESPYKKQTISLNAIMKLTL